MEIIVYTGDTVKFTLSDIMDEWKPIDWVVSFETNTPYKIQKNLEIKNWLGILKLTWIETMQKVWEYKYNFVLEGKEKQTLSVGNFIIQNRL